MDDKADSAEVLASPSSEGHCPHRPSHHLPSSYFSRPGQSSLSLSLSLSLRATATPLPAAAARTQVAAAKEKDDHADHEEARGGSKDDEDEEAREADEKEAEEKDTAREAEAAPKADKAFRGGDQGGRRGSHAAKEAEAAPKADTAFRDGQGGRRGIREADEANEPGSFAAAAKRSAQLMDNVMAVREDDKKRRDTKTWVDRRTQQGHKEKQKLEATDGFAAGRGSRAPRTPTSGAEGARRKAKDDESTSDFSELPPEDPTITRGMNTAIQKARNDGQRYSYWHNANGVWTRAWVNHQTKKRPKRQISPTVPHRPMPKTAALEKEAEWPWRADSSWWNSWKTADDDDDSWGKWTSETDWQSRSG